MKVVWVLNHYAVPPGFPGGTRHYSLASGLYSYGWNAFVLASSVDHLSGRQRLLKGEESRLEKFGSVPFLWIRTSSYRGNGGARMRNMLAYALRVLIPSSTRSIPRPDVVVGSSVHPFAAMSGLLLARRFGVPFVFEVRDLWPQTLIDMGRITSKSVTARVMRVMEGWLYRGATRIVTLLPKADDYIAQFGVPSEKVVWIPNGVDISSFPDPGPRSVGSREANLFTLMYFGSHGQANGLDCILRAMRLLQDDPCAVDVRLRMIGNGPAKLGLQRLAKNLCLKNVVFESPVPKGKIPELALEADAFVLSVLNRPDLYRYGISMNKLYDYLAGRRPILLASAAVNNPVEEAGAGLTVAPENPEAIAAAIKELVQLEQSERDRMGKAGRKYAEEQGDFGVLAGKLAEVLDSARTVFFRRRGFRRDK